MNVIASSAVAVVTAPTAAAARRARTFPRLRLSWPRCVSPGFYSFAGTRRGQRRSAAAVSEGSGGPGSGNGVSPAMPVCCPSLLPPGLTGLTPRVELTLSSAVSCRTDCELNGRGPSYSAVRRRRTQSP